jgi:tetratricopeptide (TPR) repeat protein
MSKEKYNCFSWQIDDFDKLIKAYDNRVIIIHSRDTLSPYHVFTTYNNYLTDQGHVAFFVFNNDSDSISPLLPFFFAADGTTANLRTGKSKNIAKALIKDITQLDTLAQLIEYATEPSVNSSLFLTERENDLLARFGETVKSDPPIFVFFGYPHYDTSSRNLTDLLVSGRLDDDFPFLQKAKYVFMCEESDSIQEYGRIKKHEHIDLALSSPTSENTKEILAEIVPDLEMDDTEVEKLFYLAGGRLSVLEILGRYLVNNTNIQRTTSSSEIVDLALKERMSSFGERRHQISTTLQTAAVIGSIFNIPLLEKALDMPIKINEVMEECEREYLTETSVETGRFRYDEIWRFFQRASSEKHVREISKSIAEAIYYYNPYDYYGRAHYLENAGMLQDACEVYILAYNSCFDEGRIPPPELIDRIETLSTECGISGYWSSLRDCYEARECLEFRKGRMVLDEIPLHLSTRQLLIKEYLSAICSYRFGDSLDEQRNCLIEIEMASDYAKGLEDGLWCDCQMMLISFYVNINGDIDKARGIFNQLKYYYTEKNHSLFAQKGCHVLERKCSALYSVERAVMKTQQSVNYFEQNNYPSQYIMALNNHGANLLVSGQFQDAMSTLTKASNELMKCRWVPINNMYVINNFCLCAVLTGQINANHASSHISALMEKMEFADWKIIPTINCAIYTALSGKCFEAREALLSLLDKVMGLDDDYYTYYINANLASICYLLGEVDNALSILASRCKTPPKLLMETEKIYLNDRTKSLETLLRTETISDPKALDVVLLPQHPQNTQWGFIGRGFLYSDMQFWSEP